MAGAKGAEENEKTFYRECNFKSESDLQTDDLPGCLGGHAVDARCGRLDRRCIAGPAVPCKGPEEAVR